MSLFAKDIAQKRSLFDRDGFCLFRGLIPLDLLTRVVSRMDAVVSGEYESGVSPHAVHFSSDDPVDKLRKIDQPHLSDSIIFELISHENIGRAIAGLLNAKFVQVWATQLLIKPPGGMAGHIGWHQDMQHWTTWWRGEVGTFWVAISNVSEDCGPMQFIRGSHKWGLNENSSFFSDADHAMQRKVIPKPPKSNWEEIPMLMSGGDGSFHHRFTYHGSGSNLSSEPRRSFAIHVRTERSEAVDEKSVYTAHLSDEGVCPVIYQA